MFTGCFDSSVYFKEHWRRSAFEGGPGANDELEAPPIGGGFELRFQRAAFLRSILSFSGATLVGIFGSS